MPATNARPRMGRVAFKADRATLAWALAYVNAIPDLREDAYVHRVLLTVSDGLVAVARNNGDQQHHADIAGAECVTDGCAAVNSRELAKAVSTMPPNAGMVAVVVDHDGATVTCGPAGRADLATADLAAVGELADRMPDEADVTASAMVTLGSLAPAADACAAVATAADPDLPALRMVHIDLPRNSAGWMWLRATDRHRAVLRAADVVSQTTGFTATVPADGLAAAVRKLGRSNGAMVVVDFARAQGRLTLTCGPYRAVLATGPTGRRAVAYPVKTIMRHITDATAASVATVDLPAADLMAAVRKVADAARKGVTTVGLTFALGRVDLAVRQDGQVQDTHISCDYDGPAYRVAMDADLLVASLRSLGAPRLRWHLRQAADVWDPRPQLWQPLGDDDQAPVPGAGNVTMPLKLGPDHGLRVLVAGQQNKDAGTEPANEETEEPVKFDDKVTVTHVGADGVKPIQNPWADKPEPDEAALAALDAAAWAAVQVKDWTGALEAIDKLIAARGADTVMEDEDDAHVTYGQVRAWVLKQMAEADAQADEAAEAEPEPGDEREEPAVAEPTTPAPVKAGRKATTRGAKATKPAKATRAKRAAPAKPLPAPEPAPVVAQPAVPPTHVQAAAAASVADVVIEVATALRKQDAPEHVIKAGLLATLAAIGIDLGPVPGAALARPAVARPVTGQPPTTVANPANVPAASVTGVPDGDGLRYDLRPGTPVKSTAKALRQALAAADKARGIGFHVEVRRRDETSAYNALVVTADAGTAEHGDLVNRVAGQVLGDMVVVPATA